MIDFHSHILPNMDDGSESIQISLGILRTSFAQGVDTILATSHYYADEEYPDSFLQRRKDRLEELQDAMFCAPEVFPNILPGAEVLYFPGIGNAKEIAALTIAETDLILIEPPMLPWRDAMLDDIASLRESQNCIPVIAHVDRYMERLGDNSLIDRVLERDMYVQVNADCFLNPKLQRMAFQNLKSGKIHVIGSDCHDLSSRAPNLAAAQRAARAHGLALEFRQLTRNAANLLGLKEIIL